MGERIEDMAVDTQVDHWDMPILFSGPMVRALLEGRKTQTRRAIKKSGGCPYGAPGYRLWVRETFASGIEGCPRGLSYRADHRDPAGDGPANPMRWTPSIFMPRAASRLTLTVTGVSVQRLLDISEDDAKAEGLKSMTKDGSLFKWGIPDRDGWPGTDNDGWPWHEWDRDPRKAYLRLWDKINGAGSAALNPYVWAISFAVNLRNVDMCNG